MDNVCPNSVGADCDFGQAVLQENDCSYTGNSGEYSIDESVLVINSAFLTVTAKILSLNENNLHLKYTNSIENEIEHIFAKME